MTIAAIQGIFKSHNYLIDPHTAVAAVAVKKLNKDIDCPTLILSTAHPAKFPNSIEEAGILIDEIPKRLSEVFEKKEIVYEFPVNKNAIFDFIASKN
jgi:threonine synthase